MPSPRKITTVFFPDGNGHGDWERLLSAWEASVYANVPESVEVEVIELDRPTTRSGGRQFFENNTVKLHEWLRVVEETEGDLILMDCDTLALHDPFKAFDLYPDFDVAITTRIAYVPINAGVVYIRCNEKSRQFFRDWTAINDSLIDRPEDYNTHIDPFGGVNQAALMHLLKAGEPDLNLLRLPCERWNSVDQTWGALNDETVVLHVKGSLRELVLANARPSQFMPHMQRAAELFRQYDGKGSVAA